MGCDIHLHTEVFDADSEHWRYVFPSEVGLEASPYYEGEGDSPWRTGRDYPLFAALADVRNGGAIKPVSLPRGLPGDATTLTRLASDTWGSDGHSHSWLSLDEVQAYRWDDVAALVDAEWAQIVSRSDEIRSEADLPPARWRPTPWTPGWLDEYATALGTLSAPVRLVFWFDN